MKSVHLGADHTHGSNATSCDFPQEHVSTPFEAKTEQLFRANSRLAFDPTMPTPRTDRREHRRFDILGTLWADLELADSALGPQSVRIIDISAGGTLLASALPYVVGERGTLRFGVGSHRFVVDVEVRRQSPYYDESGYTVGAGFLRLAAHQRNIVESLCGPH